MLNILVVEDESHIREFIKINLIRSNFNVFEAKTGEEAIKFAPENLIDLIILDINLPDINGYEVLKKLRMQGEDIPVIMVTAKGQDMDKIIGLELGADDYIVKPFNPLELVARINSVLRRSKKIYDKSNNLIFGNVKVELSTRRVFKNNCEVRLTPKEYELIAALASSPGKPISRDELLNIVWGQDFFGDIKTLDVHIRRIREKIEDNPAAPMLIETVWGMGYRWRENG